MGVGGPKEFGVPQWGEGRMGRMRGCVWGGKVVRADGFDFQCGAVKRAQVGYHLGDLASGGGSNQYIQRERMGCPVGVMGRAAKCRRVFRCEARSVEMTSGHGVWGRVCGGTRCGMGRWN